MKWVHSTPIKHELLFELLTSIIKTDHEIMLCFKINDTIYISSANTFDSFPSEIQDAADNVILWQKSD